MFANVIPQVSTVENVHHQVQVLSVLESIVHVYYEGVVQLRENLAFIDNGLNASLSYDSCFRHLLHRVLLLGLLSFDFPDFAETALTDTIQVDEVAFSERFNKVRKTKTYLSHSRSQTQF